MSNIDKQALLVSKAKASVFTMGYISQFEASDIDSDDIYFRFEVDAVETGTTVSIVDECGHAAQIITALLDELEAARQRIAELEDAQCQHESDTLMLCHQFDELASAMGWTSELAMKQGVGQLEYARSIKARIAELEARAVNLPKRSVDEVMHLSGFSRDYAEGWCAGNDNAIHEIRTASIKVKGE